MNERFYLLKIRLLEIEPEIRRRFAVPASISLDRLHDVIQMVMGCGPAAISTNSPLGRSGTQNTRSPKRMVSNVADIVWET